MTGHEFFWWSHGCKFTDTGHEGDHVCECGLVYDPAVHLNAYGYDADQQRRDSLMRNHGYDPELPPRGFASGTPPDGLRNWVCELEDFEIDGHSDQDRTGFCVFCGATMDAPSLTMTFRAAGPVQRSQTSDAEDDQP